MARAKRTARAEARRRYRATTEPDGSFDDAEEGGEPSKGARTSAPTGRGASTPTPARVGFVAAFRQSIRPLNVREDLVTFPAVATRSKAVWVPVLITLASTIATAAAGVNNFVTGLLFTYFVVFPAIGGVFIGGFLAPRASWLVGIVVGLVSAVCYVALGASGKLPAPFAEQFTLNPGGAAVSAFIYSPIMGAFFAAGAAWYRRFLALSSPNRNRRPSQTPKARPGDGRTRSGSQKAGVKR